MNTSTVAILAGGRFGAPAMNYHGAPQIAFAPPNDDGTGTKSVEQMADEVRGLLEKSTKETREIAEKALEEATKTGKLSEETKSVADKLLATTTALKAQLDDIEQKMARKPGRR